MSQEPLTQKEAITELKTHLNNRVGTAYEILNTEEQPNNVYLFTVNTDGQLHKLEVGRDQTGNVVTNIVDVGPNSDSQKEI